MLSHLLLSSILFAAAQDSAPTSLLAAVPADALLTVYMPEPRLIPAQRDSSDWIAFFTDPAWIQALTPHLSSGNPGALEEITALREEVLAVLADSSEAAFFVDVDLESEDLAGLGLLVRGGEEVGGRMRALLGDETETLDLEGHTLIQGGDAGEAIYLQRAGVHMLLASEKSNETHALVRTTLERFAAGSGQGNFDLPGLAAVREPATLELAVDLSGIWEMAMQEAPEDAPIEMLESLASLDWGYMSLHVGEGEDFTTNMVMPYDPDGFLGEALGFAGQVDQQIFGWIPERAVTASAFHFDLAGLSEWAIDWLAEEVPQAHEQLRGGLTFAESQLGVNPLDDIIGNFTGRAVSFDNPISTDGLEDGDPMQTLGRLYTTTMAFEILDPDPFLDLIEMGIDMSGMAEQIEESTLHGADLWTIGIMPGMDISMAVSDRHLVFSYDREGLAAFLELQVGEGESMLTNEQLSAASEGLTGAMIQVQSTSASFEMLSRGIEVFGMFARQSGDEEAQFWSAALADVAITARELGQRTFHGFTRASVDISGGMLRVRGEAR